MNSIAKIQDKLREKGLDAILITDEKNQRYAAGFPFTDGYVLVSREKAWLLTDSRYIEAAESSVDSCVTVQMFDRQHSRLSLLIAALQEAKVSRLGAEELKLNHGEYLDLEKALGLPLLPAQEILSGLRAAKCAGEIEYMRQAQRIS